MQIAELLREFAPAEYELNKPLDNREITHLSLDSRKIGPGGLYFAVRGLVSDGHAYLPEVEKKGAAAAIVEEFFPLYDSITQIKVKNARSAMSRLAAAYYGYPARELQTVAVTGTNGKTTVTFICRHMGEYWGKSTGLIGTSGIFLGQEKLDIPISTSTTPDPIELQAILRTLRNKGAELVIMEATAQAMYFHKLDGMAFTVCVFTNLTEDHLDLFKTMDAYAQAKKSLFTGQTCSCAIVNADDALGQEILSQTNAKKISYGLSQPADYSATNIDYEGRETFFILRTPQGEIKVESPLAGRFNVYNTLGAIAAMEAVGAPLPILLKALAAFPGVPGRFETPETGRLFSVVIDYAHTPDGLENILQSVAGFKKGRLLTVFGCGGNRDALKRPIMGAIAARLSDFVFVTSDNPRFEEPEAIIAQITAGMAGYTNYEACPDRTLAIDKALHAAREGDVVVIAGKGDEPYQEIRGVKTPYSDRDAVREILQKDGNLS